MNDVTHHANAVTFRGGSLFAHQKSRTLATISRGELVVETSGPNLEVRYRLRFDALVLCSTLLILGMAAMIVAFDGPKLGPFLFVVFVGWPWVCCGNVVLATISFEHWIRKFATAANPVGVPGLIEAHTRNSLRLQTAAVIAAPFFLLLFVLVLALQLGAEQRARARFLIDLNVLRPPSTVQLDGRTLSESELFLMAVRGVHHIQPHHSHPTDAITVRAADGERSLTFLLSQDSERPEEFWLEYDGSDTGRVVDQRLRSIMLRAGLSVR